MHCPSRFGLFRRGDKLSGLCTEINQYSAAALSEKSFCAYYLRKLTMNRNLPQKAKRSTTSSLRVDRITQMIIEDWPEIWQAAVDRRNQQIESRRVLILAVRDQLRKEAS
jgi:hypothetical protein